MKFSTINSFLNKVTITLNVSRFINGKIFVTILFFLSLTLFFDAVGIFDFLHLRPSSMHFSAQTQRASIALNYYKTDMNFFMPRISRQLNTDGITGVEFPIIYYAAALLYKLFGFHEIYLRLLSLSLVVFGIYQTFKLYQFFLFNGLLSFVFVCGAILSPVFLFYTPNFLPDAPSVALQMASWMYFFNYLKNGNVRQLNWFTFFATLAALIKAISAGVFFVVLVLVFLDSKKFFRNAESLNIIGNRKLVIKRVLFGLLIVLLWYLYANWLTYYFKTPGFALKPLMVTSLKQMSDIFKTIREIWMYHYFSYESYILMSIFILLFIVFFKFINRLLLTITLLYFFGSLLYCYLFLYQFRWHDYYIIAVIPFIFFLFLSILDLFKRKVLLDYKWAIVALYVVIFFNLKETYLYTKKCYVERNTREIYYWTGDFRAYEDLEPKLRRLGIKRTDRFVSGFDDTYCGSLYLIDQPGVTITNEMRFDSISGFINNKNIKYLILNDSAKFNNIYPNNFQKHIVAVHRGLIIYKLPR